MRLWKKVLAAATAGMLCLGSVGASGVQSVLESVGTVLLASATVPDSYDGTYEDLYYKVTDAGEIEITGCKADATSVEIPAEIDGKSVTSIGKWAFSDCTSLAEIIIPDDVTSIKVGAFHGCTSLAEIIIPEGVTSIEGAVFQKCTSLTEITIPNGVNSIMGYTFDCCSNLSSITIPDSIISIENNAFLNCPNIEKVYIDNLTSWCNIDFESPSANPLETNVFDLFANNANLYVNGKLETEIIIPNDVTSIGDYVFSGYTALGSVAIPDSVTSIGAGAFEYCPNLTSITIPDSVTNIGQDAFRYCKNLADISIPNSITKIEEGTFSGTSLTAITMPNKVTSIGNISFFRL